MHTRSKSGLLLALVLAALLAVSATGAAPAEQSAQSGRPVSTEQDAVNAEAVARAAARLAKRESLGAEISVIKASSLSEEDKQRAVADAWEALAAVEDPRPSPPLDVAEAGTEAGDVSVAASAGALDEYLGARRRGQLSEPQLRDMKRRAVGP